MSKVDSADLWGWSFALNFSCHILLVHYIAEISSSCSLELNTLDLGASFCDFCFSFEVGTIFNWDVLYNTGYFE